MGLGNVIHLIFPWRISCSSLCSGRSWVKVDVLRRCSPHRFWLFHLRLGKWSFHFFAALTLPLHWVFFIDFRCVHLFQFLNVCDQDVSFPDSPLPPSSSRTNAYPKKQPGKIFCSKLMQSRFFFRSNRVIFDHCSKRNYWSVKRAFRTAFRRCLSIKQEILNVSQIAVSNIP